MISLPPGLKIFIASKPMDMRKSFDGMAAIVTKSLKKDIYSGHVFAFCNKRGDRLKLIYWDRNGFCTWYKRLERGIFRLPQVDQMTFSVSPAELGLILEGIDLTNRSRLRAC